MKTYDVKFWNIRVRKEKRKPYVVRWVVEGRTFTESYMKSGKADSRRSELVTAARKGEAFDTETGLPESMHREDQDITWFQHAIDYVAAKWKKASANSRRSIVESMTAVTPALTRNLRGAPDDKTLREALRWAFIQTRQEEEQPDDVGRRQGPRFAAFFGCMYYAMMRPAEVTRLRRADCRLPESGWGKLILEASKPEVGKDYTDSGELHDDRALKGRTKKTVRVVPIPPELVALLREHIARFGVTQDGRLFRSESGRPVPKSTYSR